MSHREYLRNSNSILLCSSRDTAYSRLTFHIIERLGSDHEGASSICYRAAYEGSGKGVLKEFYPQEGFEFSRTDDGQLVLANPTDEMRERLAAAEREYLEPYEMLQQTKRDSVNQDLATFIPEFMIYHGCDADGNLVGSAYIWTPYPALKTFATICDEIHAHPEENSEQQLSLVLSAMDMLTKCVCALHYAEFVHRDINPANFGFQQLGDEILPQTLSMFDINSICSVYGRAELVMGSNGYMEPEARRMPPDNQTDIYSIGATLYSAIVVTDEAAACQYRYQPAFYDRLEEMVNASRLITASTVNNHPELRARLTQILSRCLCDRAHRYQNCEELLDDLNAAVGYMANARYSYIAEQMLSGTGAALGGTGSAAAEQSHPELVGGMPPVRDVFVGREDLMEEIDNVFQSGANALFLQGIGGIGKSELAKRYALQYRASYDMVLFATYQSSLRDLIANDEEFPIRNIPIRDEHESLEDYCARKLEALEQIGTEQTLLIIDNYNVNADPDLERFLAGPYRVILTTRNAHPDYITRVVEPLRGDEDLFQVFARNYGGRVDDAERDTLREIFRFVDGHTYTIELIAKQMRASYKTAAEMLEILRSGGLSGEVRERVGGLAGKDSTLGHLCALFDVASLTEQEQRLVRFLSLMGTRGVPAKWFKEWAELTSFNVVNDLVDRSWVRRERDNRLALHPMVIEVVHTMLEPTVRNCRYYLYAMSEFCQNAWHRTNEENLEVIDCITAVWSYFDDIAAEDYELWEPLGSIYWQVGYYEIAIRHVTMVYNKCHTRYGEASMITGFEALRVGDGYYNAGREQESIVWYKRGLDCMLAADQGVSEDLAMAYEKVARCYSWEYEQDLEKASQYICLSHNMRDQLLRVAAYGRRFPVMVMRKEYEEPHLARQQLRMAECNEEMGNILIRMALFQQALYRYKTHYRILMDFRPDDYNGQARALYNIGRTYYLYAVYYSSKTLLRPKEQNSQQLSNARTCLAEALRLQIRMHGNGASIDMIDTLAALGDVYIAMWQMDQAGRVYTQAYEMASGLLGEETPRLQRVRHACAFIEEQNQGGLRAVIRGAGMARAAQQASHDSRQSGKLFVENELLYSQLELEGFFGTGSIHDGCNNLMELEGTSPIQLEDLIQEEDWEGVSFDELADRLFAPDPRRHKDDVLTHILKPFAAIDLWIGDLRNKNRYL